MAVAMAATAAVRPGVEVEAVKAAAARVPGYGRQEAVSGPAAVRPRAASCPGPALVNPTRCSPAGPAENWGQIIISLPGLGGRAVLTVQQAQAQTVWAQQVLAQALGRLAAGQMGAGAAALALAQGQLALREGRRCCHRLWLRGHGAAGCVGRFAI